MNAGVHPGELCDCPTCTTEWWDVPPVAHAHGGWLVDIAVNPHTADLLEFWRMTGPDRWEIRRHVQHPAGPVEFATEFMTANSTAAWGTWRHVKTYRPRKRRTR